jgi:hypothetical protein
VTDDESLEAWIFALADAMESVVASASAEERAYALMESRAAPCPDLAEPLKCGSAEALSAVRADVRL